MEKLEEKYQFRPYNKGENIERYLNDLRLWYEDKLDEIATKINWLIDEVSP